MANVLSVPLSGNIYFDCGSQSSTVPDLTGSAVSFGYDGCAGVKVTSFNTAASATDRFTVAGESGSLFSVNDSLTGTVFSVNDASGLPIIEVNSNATTDTIAIGEYGTNALFVSGGNVGVGTVTPTSPLDVAGNINTTGNILSSGVDLAGIFALASSAGDITAVTAGTGLNGGGTSGSVTLNVDNALSNVTSLGTLTSLTVDDITINGSTISDSGDFTLDVGGDISLDADDAGTVKFKDGGTEFGRIYNASSNLYIKSIVSDKDLVFVGNDGGSAVEALRLDMSDAGTATFNHNVNLPDGGQLNIGANADLYLTHDDNNGYFYNNKGDLFIDQTASDSDIVFKGTDGGSDITALRLDMSDGGSAIFNNWVCIGAGSLKLGGIAVTSTAAELNKLDGFTGTCDDLNYAKDLRATGVTTTEFNCLDGLTATTANLNLLAGCGSIPGACCIGDITGVTAGTGMTGGGTSGTPTLNVIGGTGITANANDVAIDTGVVMNLASAQTASGTKNFSGDICVGSKIYHSGTSDTYLCLVDDTFRFYTGWGQVLKLGSPGGCTVFNEDSQSIDFRVESGGDTHMLFVDGDQDKVGIGTANPSKKLHVAGDGLFTSGLTVQGDLTVTGDFTCLDTTISVTSALSVQNAGTGPALIVNQTGSNDIVDFRDDGTSAFYIEDGGNVGIGITNPTTKLHVSGNALIDPTANGTALTVGRYSGQPNIKGGTDDSGYLIMDSSGGRGAINWYVSDHVILANGGGNVGVGGGNTTPSHKLDVSGNINATGTYKMDGTDIISTSCVFQGAGVDMGDNHCIKLGVGDDLVIKHNSLDTYFENYTGDLHFANYADDKDIIFCSDDGSGGVTEYFRLDGSTEQNVVSKNMRFEDNIQAQFGAGTDLRIYHDGSHSFIKDTGTGDLKISSNTVRIESDGAENMIIASANGAVNLYYNNVNQLQTTAAGATVTGDLTVSGGDITLGGTGRIQGIDTVSSGTDAANKTYADTKLPKAGGTMTGHIAMSNCNITGVNIFCFNDPGPNEGIHWTGGNTKIFESPDNLTTNSAGNLQMVYGSTRRLTVNNTGIDVNGNIVVSGTVDGVDIAARDAILTGVTNCPGLACVGDITGVTAGTGMTGGGTSGTPTLNVIGGDGITANADNIVVDSTVVRTTGNQTIGGTKNFSSCICVADQLRHTGDFDTRISFGTDTMQIEAGDCNQICLTTGGTVINEEGKSIDFRVEGDTDPHALFVDGSADNVGIGVSVPGEKLTVSGNLSACGTGFVDKLGVGAEPSGDEVLTVDGTAGNLFTITNSVTGTVFAVSDSAGLPILEAFTDSCDMITMGEYGSNALVVCDTKVGIGNATPTSPLDVTGNIAVTGTVDGVDIAARDAILTGITNCAGLACTGDITAVVAGSGLTGGASSGSATLNVGAGTAITVAADTVGVNSTCNSTWNAKTTCTGTVTSITVNTAAGLDGAGTITSSGTLNLSLDLSELTDMTGGIDTAVDEIILLDNGAERRKRFAEIFGSNAYNSTTIPTNNNQLTNGAGYTTCTGDITGVTAGTGMTGGGTSGTPTLNVIGGDGITANADNIVVDSTVVRTTGAQSIGGVKTYTSRGDFSNADGVRTNQLRTYSGQQLVLNAGESSSYATGQTAEFVYLNAESGVEINSSPDNWSSGWAGRKTSYINNTSGDSHFSRNITLGGTVDGVDIAARDAILTGITNCAGLACTGDITAVTAGNGLTGGATSGGATLNVGAGTAITVAADTVSVNSTCNSTWNAKTTCTGTTTPSNTQTFTNKSGNISQWTNNSGYTTCTGDITAVVAGTNLNGGATSGSATLNLDSAISITSATIGSGVTLSESTDRADLLYVNSSTDSWGGLQIGNTSNEFIFSLMGNGTSGGIYDDQQNEWLILWTENAGVNLYHNNSSKLCTTSTGVNVGGSITVTGTVDGVDIAARDAILTGLTSCAGLACVGDITAVTAGNGLTGGATSGGATLNVGAGTAITVAADTVSVNSTCNSTWNAKTTCTGTTTPSNTQTFTNKSGNISQWTNNSGYTTCTGDITGVTAGSLLDGGGTSGSVTLNVDLSELTDGTAAIVPTSDEVVYLDAGSQKRKLFSEIFGSNAYNSTTIPTNNNQLTNGAGYTTNTGDITAVVAGSGLTGGATSGSATVNVGAGTAITVAADTVGVTTACNTAWNLASANATALVTCAGLACTGTLGGDFLQDVVFTDGGVKLGLCAGHNVTEGSGIQNVTIGCGAGCNITTGDRNTYVGSCAGRGGNGSDNVAIGRAAMFNNGGASNNVGIGLCALRGAASSTGGNNIGVGRCALLNVSSGSQNMALGDAPLFSVTSGNRNVGIGPNTGRNVTGSDNLFFGNSAGCGTANGSNNVAIGRYAMRTTTNNGTGQRNVAIGENALNVNTSGCNNIAIGFCANKAGTTGKCNVSIGSCANGNSNLTGIQNVVIGEAAAWKSTSANGNIALGFTALGCNTTGDCNIAIGHQAGRLYSSSGQMTGGSKSIFIGYNAKGASTASPTNQIAIGDSAQACGNNTIKLGNGSISVVCSHGSFSTVSDRRDKTCICDIELGLDFIGDLRPRTFNMITDRNDPEGSISCKRHGFIAQEVLELENNDPVIVRDDNPEQLGYTGEHIIPILVKGMQEQQAIIDNLTARLEALEG